jgi:hypothetical protein
MCYCIVSKPEDLIPAAHAAKYYEAYIDDERDDVILRAGCRSRSLHRT